ncbi:hypothetical protein JCM10207_005687 [Rhodosporidiobolus poonsookiae]
MDVIGTLEILWKGLKGRYGTIGAYSAAQRGFATFAALAFGGSMLVDAPFGRYLHTSTFPKIFTVSGRVGWMLMEIVSPLSFLYFLSAPPSISPSSFPAPSLTRLLSTLSNLPRARQLLAALYVTHYANRSIVSELRNPGRSPMHVVIPILSALFNLVNGGTIGMYVAGGLGGANSTGSGLKPHSALLFGGGIALWLAGFVSNLWHDEVLLDIKRKKQAQPRQDKAGKPEERYDIPQGGLYRYLSHPSYTSEWLEWTGFTLATFALSLAPFPPSDSLLAAAGVPSLLRPLQQWYLQPPALFVLQEVAAMLPRALSGHRWYKETFGKDWEKKGARWAVIPGIC